jgi:hypothetical protein
VNLGKSILLMAFETAFAFEPEPPAAVHFVALSACDVRNRRMFPESRESRWRCAAANEHANFLARFLCYHGDYMLAVREFGFCA